MHRERERKCCVSIDYYCCSIFLYTKGTAALFSIMKVYSPAFTHKCVFFNKKAAAKDSNAVYHISIEFLVHNQYGIQIL